MTEKELANLAQQDMETTLEECEAERSAGPISNLLSSVAVNHVVVP